MAETTVPETTGTQNILTAAKFQGLKANNEDSEVDNDKKDSSKSPEDSSSSRDLFWDQALLYIASGMLALTVLEVLSSIRGESVQCFTPDNFTRSQSDFINSFCSYYTPLTDYFAFYIVAQAVVLVVPHFIWSSSFAGRFQFFTESAKSLRPRRDGKIGDYDPENYKIVQDLYKTFKNKYAITISYLVKLAIQMAIVGGAFFANFCFFCDYIPSFLCSSNPANSSSRTCIQINSEPLEWPTDLNETEYSCVLSSLNLLQYVWYANIALLAAAGIATLIGLVWFFLPHFNDFNWKLAAEFALYSGLPPRFFYPRLRRNCKNLSFLRLCAMQCCCICVFKNCNVCCNCFCKTDFQFLFLKFYRDNTGLAKVMKEVLINYFMKQELTKELELLSFEKQSKSFHNHIHQCDF